MQFKFEFDVGAVCWFLNSIFFAINFMKKLCHANVWLITFLKGIFSLENFTKQIFDPNPPSETKSSFSKLQAMSK